MRRCLLLATLGLALNFSAQADETLPQRYLAVYLKINDAEHLERQDNYPAAEQSFRDCYDMLAKIRRPIRLGSRHWCCTVWRIAK